MISGSDLVDFPAAMAGDVVKLVELAGGFRSQIADGG